MFQGFSDKTVDFMWGIRFHNQREWFLSHKEDYQKEFLAPMKALGEQVYDGLAALYPDDGLLLKVSRIYRDARRLFGRGPYKDHLWWCIRSGDRDWTGRPTFWFELGPEYYSYGLGFWEAMPILMETYRRNIREQPAELTKLVKQFNGQSEFLLTGPEYARSKGTVSPLLQPWYEKKSVSLEYRSALDERLYTPQLADDILAGYKSLMPFYRYFVKLVDAVPQEALRRRGEKQ